MNPRVLAWLQAMHLKPSAIARQPGDDIPEVTIDGYRTLWTIHYMMWITKQWRTWAASLGFTKGRDALLAGHTDDDFDRWLGLPVQVGPWTYPD